MGVHRAVINGVLYWLACCGDYSGYLHATAGDVYEYVCVFVFLGGYVRRRPPGSEKRTALMVSVETNRLLCAIA